jgi:enterochelin esterase-like enzyme
MSFRITAIVAAAIVALLTFVLWNRIPGHQPVRVAGRTVMVLTGQAMATLAVLAWLNVAYGGLFVSWNDLLGNESMNGAHFAGQQGDILLHPVAPGNAQVEGAATPVTAAAPAAAHQRFRQAGYDGFEEMTLTGARSGMRAQVFVWTPPQYAEEPHEDFPVLMLLHGIPGDPQGWMGPMNVVAHLEAAMATGTVHPYILVVPSITPSATLSAPWNTPECSNVPGYAKVATWLAGDVRDMVTDRFRALSSGLGWGVMGYSTGGFCAAKLVLQYPHLFQAAVSLSGYYSPESLLLTRNPELDRANSPLWLLGHTRTPAVSLLMTGSDQDMADPVSEITQLLAAARANRLSRDTEVRSFIAPIGGGHNQSSWEKMLPTAFTWLSQRLSGPRPMYASAQARVTYPIWHRGPRPWQRQPGEHIATEYPPTPTPTPTPTTLPHTTAPTSAAPSRTAGSRTAPRSTARPGTQPPPTQPARTEPVRTEPARTEPARTEPPGTAPKPEPEVSR